MKKIFTLFVSVVTLFSLSLQTFTPFTAQAQTTSGSFCYSFNSNLGVGRYLSSSDANALQNVLVAQGLWDSETPITSYTEAVASAVVGFQQKYAAQILTPNGLAYGTGYVGAATRIKLNSLYTCSTNTTTNPTQSFQCPSGWVCISPQQTVSAFVCPNGWVCSQATDNNFSHTPPTIQPYNPFPVTFPTPVPAPVPTHTPTASDQQVTFTKSFTVGQLSSPVTLYIEADNEYSVSVNGILIATNNNEANFFTPTTYDLTQYIHSGTTNTLSIVVTNNYTPGFVWAVNPGSLAYKIMDGSGATITTSDGTEQSSVLGGITGSAMVIPPNYVYSLMWRNLPGANWIWDTNLLNQYAINGSTQQTTVIQ